MNNLSLVLDTINNGFFFISLFIISVISAICGILVITSKNPITSILYLISLFVTIAGYLMLLGINFIGISYLLVYVGAVSILFLFILMLINIRISEIVATTSNNLPLAIIVGSIFLPVTYKALPSVNAFNMLITENKYIKSNVDNNTIFNNEIKSIVGKLTENSVHNTKDIDLNTHNKNIFIYDKNLSYINDSEFDYPSSINMCDIINNLKDEYIINDIDDVVLTCSELIKNEVNNEIEIEQYFLNDLLHVKLETNFIELNYITKKIVHYIWEQILVDISHINSIGNILYTNYFIWLLLSSMILLLALVGCVVITIKNYK